MHKRHLAVLWVQHCSTWVGGKALYIHRRGRCMLTEKKQKQKVQGSCLVDRTRARAGL